MTPEPNSFKVEQNPIPQVWKEAVVNPDVWGDGTYTCKVTTKDGKEVYGYIESGLGLMEIPILFDKKIPDRALHLYSDLMQAHITFDLAKRDMVQINTRRLDTSTGASVETGLGINLNGLTTETGLIYSSFINDMISSGVETRVLIKYESKDVYSKLKVHNLANELEKGLGWKVEPVKVGDLKTICGTP